MVDGGEMIAAVGFLVRRADANWEGRVGLRRCVPNVTSMKISRLDN